MKRVMNLCLFLVATIITSCAGPISPFGRINTFSNWNKKPFKVNTIIESPIPSQAKISFYPKRQLWHEASKFVLQIEDRDGVLPSHEFKIYYGDMDITNQFISDSVINMNKANTKVSFTLDNLNLLPNREHKIFVSYQRDHFTENVEANYEDPYCNISNDEGNKSKNYKLKDSITSISSKNNINPNLVAGLIAQESNFNSKAVSWAKAIGLTQVTPLAEEYIVDLQKEWPRYPDINKFSVSKIKTLIWMKKINAQNEWRLDPDKSIEGGVHYLNYIRGYWNKEKNKKIFGRSLASNEGNLFDVILASYNSGPYRVKRNLMKKRDNWKEAKNLKEARKYIKKVKSYCYHFSRPNLGHL